MKVIAVFCTLLAVSLAAPSADEKPVVSEKIGDTEKSVEKDKAVNPLSPNDEKVVDEASLEEKAPIVVVATSVDKDGKDGKPKTDEEKLAIHKEYSEICRASTGATKEQIAAISEDPVEDAPKSVKCYIKCVAEKHGVEKDDVTQKEVARRNRPSNIGEEEFEAMIETCGALATDDPCDSAYLRYSCYFRESGHKLRIH